MSGEGSNTMVQNKNLSLKDLMIKKSNEIEGLKSHFVEMKEALSELTASTKKNGNDREHVGSMVLESEKVMDMLMKKQTALEELAQQLKGLQVGHQENADHTQHTWKYYTENFDVVNQKIEDVKTIILALSKEGSTDTEEVKSSVMSVLKEVSQMKKDFMNHQIESNDMKNMRLAYEKEKKGYIMEIERLKNIIQSLMKEKEELFSALKRKDNDYEQLKLQRDGLGEEMRAMISERNHMDSLLNQKEREISGLQSRVLELQQSENKLIEIQQREEMLILQRKIDAAMDQPEESPSQSIEDASFSEELTPSKTQIKRKPLTEEEAIVQSNFQGKIDIVFCLDCTKSMDPYIANAKLACSKIMNVLDKSRSLLPLDLKFGVVGYRDHGSYNNNTWVTKIHDLGSVEASMDFIKTMDAQSSLDNDFPEAVMPALSDCADKITWRDNSQEKVLRIVFHIADSPPHGKMFYKGKNDKYPKGDPSGIKTMHIAPEIR